MVYIIYIDTLWVILVSAYSKSIQNWKQKLITWNDISSAVISKLLNCCLRTFIILWLVCLYCSNTNLFLLTWGCSFIAFHYFDWNILTFWTNFKRPSALKEHTLWCKSGIYCWNLSEKVCLMYGNSFPILLPWNLKYISLYFTHNSVKSSCQ